MSRQFFDLKVGQSMTIGDSRVTLEAKSGQRARLKVETSAPTARDDMPRPKPVEPAKPVLPFLPRPKAIG